MDMQVLVRWMVGKLLKEDRLLGVDRKTLAKNKEMLDRCSEKIGDKPKVIRDRLLKELKII